MANNTKGTLKYRKVKRIPPLGENAGKEKWYATVVTDRELSFEDFVNHISDHGSPYSRGCINGVLTDALDCLQELILDGKSVRLGDLGLFSIGMASKAEETAKDVSAQSIKKVHLIVRNTRTWSNSELSKKCKLKEYDAFGTDDTQTDSPGSGDNGGAGGSGSTGDTTNPGGTGTPGGSESTEGGGDGE